MSATMMRDPHVVIVGTLGAIETRVPRLCERQNNTAHFHTKSWSYRFVCPACGMARRYNTNFLGKSFRLVCDGQKITRVHRGSDAARMGAAQITDGENVDLSRVPQPVWRAR